MTTFQKLNLANCARMRAEANVLDSGTRFNDEYNTALMWMRHDVVTIEGTSVGYWF